MDKKESPCFNMPMKKKSVQIVLVSDNHGSREPLEYVRRTHADADSFIHCGDVELPTYLVNGFAVVQGNNDNYQQFPARRIIELGEHRIYVCHGHRDMFFGHFDMLSEKAKAEGCDIVFFGHTHIPFDKTIGGVRVINPGSIWMNRDGSEPSYMIVTLNGKSVEVERKTFRKSDLKK